MDTSPKGKLHTRPRSRSRRSFFRWLFGNRASETLVNVAPQQPVAHQGPPQMQQQEQGKPFMAPPWLPNLQANNDEEDKEEDPRPKPSRPRVGGSNGFTRWHFIY